MQKKKSKNPNERKKHLLHTACNWYELTLKFEVKILQSIPLLRIPPLSLPWYSYLQSVQEPLRHLTLHRPVSKLKANENLLANLISSQQVSFSLQCSFCCCHTVSLLNTGSVQFVNLPVLCQCPPRSTTLWGLKPWRKDDSSLLCHGDCHLGSSSKEYSLPQACSQCMPSRLSGLGRAPIRAARCIRINPLLPPTHRHLNLLLMPCQISTSYVPCGEFPFGESIGNFLKVVKFKREGIGEEN